MTRDQVRQLATVLIFIVTVAINGAANALPINGQTTAEISDRFRVFVIPAGYVFAIWGLIYLGLAASPSTRPCAAVMRWFAAWAGCRP